MSSSVEFWKWFDLKREGTPIREVERRGGAPHGRISNVYKRKEPSALVCETIAIALGLDPVEVFKKADLIPTSSGQSRVQPDMETMVSDLWHAWKQQQPAESPAVVVPPPVNLPDDEDLMELFQTLDLTRKRQAYDYLRFILKQQLDPADSSGHHERERKRQEYQRVIGDIDLYLAVHQATPEELERLILELVSIVEAMPNEPYPAAGTGPAAAARPIPPPAARPAEPDDKLAKTPHPGPG